MAETAAQAPRAQAAGRCFLCDAVLRADYGEPIDGGEGVELCRACGVMYVHPSLCC